jgi:CBS domain-containing protein
MKIREIMTTPVVQIQQDETVEVAARTMARYNIGAIPVCGQDGKLCGVLTDRDMVTRCLAAGRQPQDTKVADVMSGNVISAQPDMDVAVAAHLMGRKQVRRLPVVENGKLLGMVSLGDMANREDSSLDAADALSDICSNIT